MKEWFFYVQFFGRKQELFLKANQNKYIFLGGNMKAKIIAKFVIAAIILGECLIFTTTIY
jgi:hypothetical protein